MDTGIDPVTGALKLESGTIDRDTTKSALLGSALFLSGRHTNEAEGWYSAELHAQWVAGALMEISLLFHREVLHDVRL